VRRHDVLDLGLQRERVLPGNPVQRRQQIGDGTLDIRGIDLRRPRPELGGVGRRNYSPEITLPGASFAKSKPGAAARTAACF